MGALSQILTPGRTLCRASSVSKKRLFETIAEVVCAEQPALPQHEILDQLNARERLGSTGLGGGIAIPHCRVEHCPQPLGALLTLAEPIAFDAPDGEPVDLLFALLVPVEAEQAHLDLLAEIAGLFSQPDYCQKLRDATADRALYDTALGALG